VKAAKSVDSVDHDAFHWLCSLFQDVVHQQRFRPSVSRGRACLPNLYVTPP